MQFDPKGQQVRLLDIFVIGPLILWGAVEMKKEPLKSALTIIGLGTILYNAVNYERVRRHELAEKT